MLTIDFPPRIVGGEGVYSAAIAPMMAERGVELEVVAPSAPGDREYDATLPFRVRRVEVTGTNFISRNLSFRASTRELVQRYRGEVVYALRPVTKPHVPLVAHFHVTRAGLARAALCMGKPVEAIANAIFIPLERRFARSANVIAGVNSRMRSELALDRTTDHRDLAVIANGVHAEQFSPKGRSNYQGGRVLFVGRLDPLKRIPDLLHAIAALAADNKDLSLTIAGAGRERSRIEALARSLGLSNRIRFLSPEPYAAMPGVYREHDLLVLPSTYESFGLVTLEAMACGTPAITSKACAALGQDRFDIGNIEQISALICEHLSSATEWQTRSNSARELALKFTWARIADELLKTLGRAMAATARRSTSA